MTLAVRRANFMLSASFEPALPVFMQCDAGPQDLTSRTAFLHRTVLSCRVNLQLMLSIEL